MFRSTGGNRRKRVTRRQCHAVNHHTCFGSAVPACCMKWHTGLALCQRCLVQCEPTEVEKWQAFESLCEKGFSFCGKLHFITNWPLNIKAWFFKLKKNAATKSAVWSSAVCWDIRPDLSSCDHRSVCPHRTSSVSTTERTARCMTKKSMSLWSSDRWINTLIELKCELIYLCMKAGFHWGVSRGFLILLGWEENYLSVIKHYVCWCFGQAMRTPSRNQAGLELLMEYYNQMYYLDQRFFPLHRNLGVHFHW